MTSKLTTDGTKQLNSAAELSYAPFTMLFSRSTSYVHIGAGIQIDRLGFSQYVVSTKESHFTMLTSMARLILSLSFVAPFPLTVYCTREPPHPE